MYIIHYYQKANMARLNLCTPTEYGTTNYAVVQEFKNCTLEYKETGFVIIRDFDSNFMFTGIVHVVYE